MSLNNSYKKDLLYLVININNERLGISHQQDFYNLDFSHNLAYRSDYVKKILGPFSSNLCNLLNDF